MTTRWEKFWLLIWKNWLLQIRHKTQTIAELLIPVVFSGLLVYIRCKFETISFSKDFIYDALEINNFTVTRLNMTLAYSPRNPIVDKFMDVVGQSTNLTVSSFNNSKTLEQHLLHSNDFAGLEFDDNLANAVDLPDKLKCAFRFPGEVRHKSPKALLNNWRTNFLAPYFGSSGARNYNDSDGGCSPGYYAEGFIYLQQVVFNTFMNIKNQSNNKVPEIHLRRFPYPAFIQDNLMKGLGLIASLIFLFSFAYPCVNIVKLITTEKEKKLKEAMKIMGLANWLHWTAWFTKCLLFLVVTITLIVLVLTIPWISGNIAVFSHSSSTALWLFLFTYSTSTITFCFMLSIFFSNANTASAVAGMLWFVTFFPFLFIFQILATIGFKTQMISCFLSNVAMGLGVKTIIQREANGEGLQFINFFEPLKIGDRFCFRHVMLMLVIDSFIYLTITLCVELYQTSNIDWNFKKPKIRYAKLDDLQMSQLETRDTQKSGIQIRNLKKQYANKKIAVEDLTLNMYEDQITVLLGHNGAGKTTTMSMLTGMMTPTSGTAFINGRDIKTEMEQVRGSLGLCPQYDILFDELTVREHIVFFCRLKGVPKKLVEAEVLRYVELLDLKQKVNNPSHSLSGGMKRKLSVGVALCGGSKVVLFDEPTSGIDPSARRAVWDLLLQEKRGRTILLSTHFMDEADILGDRIAIMAEGQLKDVGSSFYLKKKYGEGYCLVCVKGFGCNPTTVTESLQKHIPGIVIKTNIGSELSYELKTENIDKFQVMLEDLEANADDLKLLSYGLSLTAMEEVFMKVGSDYMNNADDQVFTCGSDVYIENLNTKLLTGIVLFLNQLLALFTKRCYHTIRNWPMLLIQTLIPIVFVSLAILCVRTWHGNSDLPELEMTISQYGKSVTLLESTNKTTQINQHYRRITIQGQSVDHLVKEVGNEEDMVKYFLRESKEKQATVNARYLIGASISEESVTVWFNNQPFHTAPIALNTVHNAILGAMLGGNYYLNITNKPLPFKPETKLRMLSMGNNLGFLLSLCVGFAMAFVGAFNVIPYVKERASKAKLLQLVSGVNIVAYWCTAFVWDYLMFIVTAYVTLLTLFAYQESGWATADELSRVFIVLLIFGFAMLPYPYLASTMFTIPATGFTRMSIFFIFTGIGLYALTFALSNDLYDLKETADKLTDFFQIFPHFALSDAIDRFNSANVRKKLIPQSNINHFDFQAPGVGWHLMYMTCSGIVLFALLMFIELRVFNFLVHKLRQHINWLADCHSHSNSFQPMNDYFDNDVFAEAERIEEMSPEDYQNHNLVLSGMTKFYNGFLAVNRLNVAISPSECFGLLGINGAGKTTTFKMLIGDEKISSGDSFVQGMSLKRDMKCVHKQIGYCPQFDALIDDLTGRETLNFFCMLQGVQRVDIERVSKTLANELNFMQHIDKLVREYSGGNKRKLSTAVALLGNPSVIFLDEPTTGMDPGAKRHLWSAICKVRNQGRSIVLTSHSMEECEALCTRIAIMVSGEFKCLGSVQHLKSTFSKGFILKIKVKCIGLTSKTENNRFANDLLSIKNFIYSTFDSSKLKEEFQGLLTYHIPKADLKWSKIFGLMEQAKTKYQIEDYSIGQTSLEQVFLGFCQNNGH